jgi:outer membrane receptor protein involved in Fe transport
VQDEWRILPSLTINYGARFDGVSEFVSETQLSPRVNLVWRPTRTTTLHAGYSRYFTPPPFEEVTNGSIASLQGTSAASAVTLNDRVRPERDHYVDAGIDQIVIPGLHLGLDAYYKQATDLIDEGQFGAPIILSAFNYAKGQVHGYEASLSYDRGPLSLYANLAWSRAIGKDIVSSQFDFSAEDLAYIANRWVHLDHDQRWTGSGGAAYTLFHASDHPLRASTDLVVGSGLRADGGVPNGRALPGYYVVNASLVQTLKHPVGHGTDLRLDILNLLDRRYIIRDGSGIGVGAPQFGLRRTVLVGVTQRF